MDSIHKCYPLFSLLAYVRKTINEYPAKMSAFIVFKAEVRRVQEHGLIAHDTKGIVWRIFSEEEC